RAARSFHPCRNLCSRDVRRNFCTTPEENPDSNTASSEAPAFAHVRALLQLLSQQSPSCISCAPVREHSSTNGSKKPMYPENPVSWLPATISFPGQLPTTSTGDSAPAR